MNATHGPWKIVEGDNGLDGIGRVIVHHKADLSFRQIATAYAGEEDREANARLIAAAPDLRDAVQLLMASLVEILEANDMTDQCNAPTAHAAIAVGILAIAKTEPKEVAA